MYITNLDISVIKIKFSYFSTKTYAVDTQKNRFNETVLLSIQNKCKKKIQNFTLKIVFLVSRPMVQGKLSIEAHEISDLNGFFKK